MSQITFPAKVRRMCRIRCGEGRENPAVASGRREIKSALWAALLPLVALIPAAQASITYVDATTNNTTLQGAPLVAGANYTTSSAAGTMDNLWHLRTGVGNGNGVWTADDAASGDEDVAPLITTITFPEAGGYRLFAYLWDSDDAGEDWDATLRLGNTGVFSTIQASEVDSADPARFSGTVMTSEPPRRLVQVPLGVVTVPAGGTAQVWINDDSSFGSHCTWYDGVGYERVFGALGERIIAIDCNKTNSPVAPSQAMFRLICGSSTTSQNSTNIVKPFSPYTIQVTKGSTANFEFRGANGDTTRVIPGGPTGLSFLVADFLGSRDGTIRIGISNLAAGTYLFRSYHLDTFTNTANLGFAQGSTPTTPNTLRAHVAGALEAIVQPTCLGPGGLNSTFISDSDIPTLSFPVTTDGATPVAIILSSLYTNGVDRYIFLNGFEVYSTTP
jgi:hypothetical protein